MSLCEECASYSVMPGGEIICSRQGLGETCHACDQEIEWSPIQTGEAGRANYEIGRCECGEAWRAEERGAGNPWHYSYEAPEEEEEEA